MTKVKINSWMISPIASLLIGLIGVATSSLLARGLGPTGRGILAESMLWPHLVLTLGAVVNTQSVVYFWTKTKLTDTTHAILGDSLILAGLLTVILLPAAWVTNFAALGWQNKISYAAADLYAWSIPISLFSACLVPVFLAEAHLGTFWGVRLVNSLLYLVGLVILAASGNLSVPNCILVILFAMIISTVIAAWLYLKNFLLRLSWNRELFHAMIAYGTKTNLAGLPYSLNVRLDQLLISLWLPVQTLGYYATAFAWSSILSFLGGGVSVMILLRSASTDRFDRSNLAILVDQFRLVAMVLFGLGVAAATVTPIGLPLLFGKEFIPSVLPATVLCLASIILNMNLTLHELIRGLGFPGIGIWGETVGLGFMVVLLCFLLPRWGGTGAAVASLVSYGSVFVTLLVLLSRRVAIPVNEFILPRKSDFDKLYAWLSHLL